MGKKILVNLQGCAGDMIYSRGIDGTRYEIHKATDDPGYFDIILARVRRKAKLQMAIDVGGGVKQSELVVPEEYSSIYRDGHVIVVDTNAPDYLLDPNVRRTMQGPLHELVAEVRQELNPYADFPIMGVGEDSYLAVKGVGSFPFEKKPFKATRTASDRAGEIDSLIEGAHPFTKDTNGLHLILNQSGNTHEDVFLALQSEYGRTIQRATINSR